jgi:hypothetical protein
MIDFVRQRRAVVRRPALQDIHDVHVRPLPAASFDDFGQKLSGAANEGLTQAILIGARCFAKERNPWLGIADAEHRLFATCGQFPAEQAGPNLYVQFVEQTLAALRRIGQVARIRLT